MRYAILVSEELPRNLKILGVVIQEDEIPRFSYSTAEGALATC